jgi:hypothetical protein
MVGITAIARAASRAIVTATAIAAAVANSGARSPRRKVVETLILSSSGTSASRANSRPLKVAATKPLARSSRPVSSSLSKHLRNLGRKVRARKVRGRKEPPRRHKARVNGQAKKANVAIVASAVNAAVVAVEAVVVAVVVVAVVTTAVAHRPAVAKVRAAAHPTTAPTFNLASHSAAIQARALLRADRNRSSTPSRVKVTRASPLRLHLLRNLANPRLRARANPAAEISSRCGPHLPARAAAHGDRAVRHVARSKK